MPDIQNDLVHDSKITDSNSMKVEYWYSPVHPNHGCSIELRLSFEKNGDPSQKYSNVQYDIFTVDDQGLKLSSLAQDKGKTVLFAPVGDDYNTFVLKGTTPVTHFIIAVLGTGPEGSLPDTSLAGIVTINVKIQESSGSTPRTNSTTSMNTVSTGESVIVANDIGYTDWLGLYTIVGEVLNNGENYVTNIQVNAKLKDASGNLIDVEQMTINSPVRFTPATLAPNSKVGFEITVFDHSKSKLASTYDISVQYDTAATKVRTLTITDSNFYKKRSDTNTNDWTVVGEVKNLSGNTATGTYVIATLYDPSGKVIGVGGQTAFLGQPSTIGAGKTQPFSFDILSIPSDFEVKKISAYVESEQSVIIPEFPFTMLTLIVATLSIVLIPKIRHC